MIDERAKHSNKCFHRSCPFLGSVVIPIVVAAEAAATPATVLATGHDRPETKQEKQDKHDDDKRKHRSRPFLGQSPR